MNAMSSPPIRRAATPARNALLRFVVAGIQREAETFREPVPLDFDAIGAAEKVIAAYDAEMGS